MNQQRKLIRLGLSTLLIVLLIVLMIEIFGEPSPSAYNARTVTQLQQYVMALELLRSEGSTYPITNEFVCLGDYDDDACWDKAGRGVKEDARFNEAFMRYVPLLSSGPMVEDDRSPSEDREGYIYRSLNNGRGFEILYMLAGSGRKCGFGSDITVQTTESQKNENTLCTIVR